MSPRRRLRATALAIALAIAPATLLAQSAPRDHTGVWWNAAESGWGVFTIDFGDVIAPTWYTYDENGDAVWFLVAGALPQPDGSYAGDVYRFTGVPFAQIAGNAADPGTKIGTATFRFTGEDALALTYTIGTATQVKQLTRFEFGSDDLVCTSSTGSRANASNYSDLWWNPVQNGWGMTVTHVADVIYLTWYTYGDDREAIWFTAALALQDDGSFAGALYRGTEGTPFLQINGSPASAGPELVGEAVLEFSDGETGEFTYTVGSVTQTQPIERFVVGSNPPMCETVTAPPPDNTVQCLPELQVTDKWRDHVARVSAPAHPFLGGTDREVTSLGEFDDVPALVIERHPSTLQDVLEAKEYVVQDATSRTLLAEELFDVNDGTLASTAEYVPPFATPRRFTPGETVTIEYEVRNDGNVLDVVRTYKLVETGPVTAHLGTFPAACKLETTYTATGTSGNTTLVETVTAVEWWDGDFGLLHADEVVTGTVTEGNAAPVTETATYHRKVIWARMGGVVRPGN